MLIDKNKTVAEIVLEYPDTIPVMNAYKVDYCCNGYETLEVALNKMETEVDLIVKDLHKAIKSQTLTEVVDWKAKKNSEIINYILNKHHTYMKTVLKELNELVFTVLRVHFKNHGDQLLQVHHLVGLLKTDLEAHLVKEEEVLFPMIIEYENSNDKLIRDQIRELIRSTEHEHDVAGDLFKELEKVTLNFTPPLDACSSYKRVFQLIESLEKDTFNHIHLENSVLFLKIN